MSVSRRTLFRGAIAAGGAIATGGLFAGQAGAAPTLIRSGRPSLTHGVQSGDITVDQATVWARADRPSRMPVEVATDPSFRRVRRVPGALLLPDSDFTGKTLLPALPDGTDLYYRVAPVDLSDPTLFGQPITGHLRTVPRHARD
ncbi:MAG TPA: PhoD-like phosphatase N-terminal domain-containing protein, partial [Pseudonocardiaceae bacterium]